MKLRDGAIIGDGRSDYTLETTSYDFSYIDKKFSILDVPGIEGTEKKVWNEISKAIQKAHAVFYVTSSPKPLQIGDDNVKGTLEKIKESLGAQTGIYGLYNKRIKNPIVLKKQLIANDEKESLGTFDKQMKEVFGECYEGHKVIAGRAAFLSVATCLLENSQICRDYEEQKKFLEMFSRQELEQKSLFDEFIYFILGDLIKDYKEKIKKANYTKAWKLTQSLIDTVNTYQKELEDFLEEITEKVEKSKKQIDKDFEDLQDRLKSGAKDRVSKFISQSREELYTYIEKYDCDNEDVKRKLEDILNNTEGLQHKIVDFYQKEIADYQERVQRIIGRFLDCLACSSQESFQFSTPIIEINTHSGFQFWGFVGGVGGVTVGVIALLSNPIGWTIATAAGIATIAGGAIATIKSVRSFFSTKYKKSQQKKAVDKDLSNAQKAYEKEVLKNLDSGKEEFLRQYVTEVQSFLDQRVEQTKTLLKYVKAFREELEHISDDIKREGGI